MRHLLLVLLLIPFLALADGPEDGCFEDDLQCKADAAMEQYLNGEPSKPVAKARKSETETDRKWWKWIGAGAAAVLVFLIADDSSSSNDKEQKVDLTKNQVKPKQEPKTDPDDAELPVPDSRVDPDPMPVPDTTPDDVPVPKPTPDSSDVRIPEPETVTAWDMWNDDRMTYDVMASYPMPMPKSGTKPAANYRYIGSITGTISPNHDHLTEPMITLQINNEITGINAGISYLVNGDSRSTLARYGARLMDDGTFDSFSMRNDDGMPVDGNPSGFSGSFLGESHDGVAGHVITPRVYGTYKAEVE